jgi:hypothetical protein
METRSTLSMSNLRAQIFLGKMEEKRLRAILTEAPIFKVKMQTRFDLEKLLRKSKAQSEELAILEAEGQP